MYKTNLNIEFYKNLIGDAVNNNKSKVPNNVLSKLNSYFKDILSSSVVIKSESDVGVVSDSLLILDSFFAKGLSSRIITFTSNPVFNLTYIKNIAFACLRTKKRIPNSILVIGTKFKENDYFTTSNTIYSKQVQSNKACVIRPKFISYVMRNKSSAILTPNTVETMYKIRDAHLYIKGMNAVLICPNKDIQEVVHSKIFENHFNFIARCMIIVIA